MGQVLKTLLNKTGKNKENDNNNETEATEKPEIILSFKKYIFDVEKKMIQ